MIRADCNSGRAPHAHIFKSGSTWYYKVYDRDNRVVFEDNTGAWDVLIEPAIKRVITAREMESIKQQLPLYADLVAAAEIEAELEEQNMNPIYRTTPDQQRELKAADLWDLSQQDGPTVWEWEDGGGFSVLTHNTAEAQDLIYKRLLVDLRDFDAVLDALPSGKELSSARRLWVNPKKFEEQGHKHHWWFGRRPIMLISYSY